MPRKGSPETAAKKFLNTDLLEDFEIYLADSFTANNIPFGLPDEVAKQIKNHLEAFLRGVADEER